ncbi:MAG: hypothetical protein Kow00124_07450 [Anaerolineae bacterium]
MGRTPRYSPDDRQNTRRMLDPLTAAGVLLVLIAVTALATYGALILPGRIAAAGGPPAEFRAAATQQAAHAERLTLTPRPDDSTPTAQPESAAPAPPTRLPGPVAIAPSPTPTTNPRGDWPLPDDVEIAYWISIPNIGLEAPVIALAPREREVDGQIVRRLPVPNSYSVAWDSTSAEPGLPGNAILTGHNNLYGGVFQNLQNLQYGWEIAIWSQYGVFSFYVTDIVYLEEDDQPLEVRLDNAQWLSPSADTRLTIVTCWPNDHSTHRLVIVAKP